MDDAERQPLIHVRQDRNAEYTPLLPSDREHISSLRHSRDFIACHIVKIHSEDSWVWRLRHKLQNYLSSKWGHYFVICLVAADIACIFASFLTSLHICEHGGKKGFDMKAWNDVNSVLEAMSLVFSCLFMAELLGSVFAFGFFYFNSPFHIFDALVIIVAFVIDIVLREGTLEEAGSLIIILRLWRVFKIIEEFSSPVEDQLTELQEKIQELRQEKEDTMKENEQLRLRLGENGYADADANGGLGGMGGVPNGEAH